MAVVKPRNRVSRDDRWFRIWISLFGLLVLAIVVGIGFVL